MKAVFVLGVCLAIFALSTCAEDTYDSKYDSIDIDGILQNDRVLGNYLKCIMGNGACTKEGRLLKHDLPDAINTNCAKCTDAQKKIVRKASKHIMEKKPEEWKKLQAKFDPNGEHTADFQKFVNEE